MSLRPLKTDIDIDELLSGATEVIGREALEKKIRAGKRLVVKHGVDPTARDLHLGYAVNYQVMRRFQDAGHQVVLLIGDFTSRIGDPTGKDKTRPQLSNEVIEANIESMLKQVGKVLDTESLIVRRNSEWLGKMDLTDFLRLSTHISAARLWEREMFKRRLAAGSPVFVHEFLYPIMQGYDSYMLHSDVTVNGSDQKFNELMGREIQEVYGCEPQSLLIMPILPGTDGVEKMSQSLGNYIGLCESPDQQYGKTLSIPDALMRDFYTLCTRIPASEVSRIFTELENGGDPMAVKMRLAREIVTQYHSAEAAAAAEARFIQVHRERAVPEDVPELEIDERPIWICEVLRRAGMVKSGGEARRTVEQGGLKIDGEVVTDATMELKDAGEYLLQKGKRHFLRLKLK